jgi:hypothetical protein
VRVSVVQVFPVLVVVLEGRQPSLAVRPVSSGSRGFASPIDAAIEF